MEQLSGLLSNVEGALLKQALLVTGLRVTFTLVIGYIGLKLIMRFAAKMLAHHATEHIRKMILHGIYYAVVLLILFSVLHELNFQIGALLGAAGILTAAIGFASQTSISNIISGLFLLSESFYKVGDEIEVGGISGTVDSIDLLSVKLRHQNGTFMRVPHTTLITSTVVNVSYFVERRFDFKILVSQKEDSTKIMKMIQDVVKVNKYVIKELPLLLHCEEFDESAIKLHVGVWVRQAHWQGIKQTIIAEIQQKFRDEHITMPLSMYVSFDKIEQY